MPWYMSFTLSAFRFQFSPFCCFTLSLSLPDIIAAFVHAFRFSLLLPLFEWLAAGFSFSPPCLFFDFFVFIFHYFRAIFASFAISRCRVARLISWPDTTFVIHSPSLSASLLQFLLQPHFISFSPLASLISPSDFRADIQAFALPWRDADARLLFAADAARWALFYFARHAYAIAIFRLLLAADGFSLMVFCLFRCCCHYFAAADAYW